MNDDVCSAEILMFTSLRSLLNPVHCHPSRDCSASGSDRKDHPGIDGIFLGQTTHLSGRDEAIRPARSINTVTPSLVQVMKSGHSRDQDQ
jgi:hypothetical protein